MAVGSSENTGHTNGEAFAELWNGSTWAIVATPNPTTGTQSALLGVSCTSATACTAVGGDLRGNTRIEGWDGTKWTAESAPDGGTRWGVSCTSATACTAVGRDGATASLTAEVWNGTAWTIQGLPQATGAGSSGALGGVSCISATACTAVGTWASQSGHAAMYTLAEQHS
jgi:hypothetical protein